MTDTMRNLRSEAVDFLHKHGDLTFSAAYAAVDKLCSNGFYITRTPTPDPRDAVIARLVGAAEALGAMPEGYCFCRAHRIGDDSKVHEPECADLRAALAAAKEVMK